MSSVATVATYAPPEIIKHSTRDLELLVVAWFAVGPSVARELGPRAAAAAFGRDPYGAVDYERRAGRPAGILRTHAFNAPVVLRDAQAGGALFTELEGRLVVAMVIQRTAAFVR
jgi:hypothetical protein